MNAVSESRTPPHRCGLPRLRQGRAEGGKGETPIALTIGVFFMADPVRGHDHSKARVPQQSSCPHPCGVRWPETWCYGSCTAVGRVAGWCFTSAVPATGDRSTAGTDAGGKRAGNNGGPPTDDTSTAGRDVSITATASGPTGNAADRRVTDHTSAGMGRSGNIVEPVKETGMSTPLAEELQDRPRFERLQSAIRPVCILCGRGGHVGVKRIAPERRQ